jgi:cytochrome P450
MTDIPGTLLLDPAVIDDPHGFYCQLRDRAPVWTVGDSGLFTVSSFGLVAEATSRTDDFSSNLRCLLYRDEAGLPCRWDYGDAGSQALATADPPLHALHRKAVFPELVARRMQELEGDIAEVADRGIRRALDAGTADFMAEVGNLVPITVISQLIGFQDSDLDQLLAAAFDSTAMLGATLSHYELLESLDRVGDIGTWINGQLAAAIEDPGDDLLGAVARSVVDGILSDFEAYEILHTLLSAGGESTTSLLGNAARMLAEDQDLQSRLRSAPDLIPTFLEEALRLEPPFRYHMRTVPNGATLGGVDIPAGSTLLLLWGAANRDEAEYERPDEIDLERPAPHHHLAFGRGIHHCVGAPLARIEARVVLTRLLEATSTFTLDPGDPPRWVNSLMVRRHEKLPLRLTAR